jgi:hypothetical protein
LSNNQQTQQLTAMLVRSTLYISDSSTAESSHFLILLDWWRSEEPNYSSAIGHKYYVR